MHWSIIVGFFGIVPPLVAQTAAPLSKAAASITASDVGRHIGVIADDSMMGRDTPSQGLERTAEYVAHQFQRFGLRPGGDNSTWFQRYPVSRRRLDLENARVTLSAKSNATAASSSSAARLVLGQVPEKPVSGQVMLISGPVSAESVEGLSVGGKLVLLPFGTASLVKPSVESGVRALYLQEPKAILLMAEGDSSAFARRTPKRPQERTVVGRPRQPPVVEMHAAAVQSALQAAGLDLAAARASRETRAREVAGLTARVDLQDSVLSSFEAPNTVGILEGSDPRLKNEYLVYSAHMDHIGITSGQRDSINNGADDDGSGTVGVIELAEAFSRPGARPKRSIIFLTVSGEEKGLWGSNYFVTNPPVPIDRIVANINMDMIGRNWVDTIVAIGKEHSDLGATLNRVNAAHPELRMTAIDDQWPEERFYFRSDHYNFARKGVPILFFFNGVHEDYHEVSDSPDKINSEKEARILKLLFYLGQDIANAAKRPQWREESKREIVEE